MPQISRSKYLVQAGWDSVPHIDEATKADLLASTPPHLRDARSKGIPSLGSGAIYPVSVEQITVEPFSIPAHWKRGYALDVGWNKTAAIWGAQDPTDGVLYAYAEHYQGQQQAIVHAAAIKARGGWMHGAIDPASRGRSQSDGTQLLSQYEDAGLNLSMAKNNVEAGLHLVWTLLSTGQLKLFTTLQNTIAEYRIYQRDENGKVKKENDHAMDALRYLCMTWDVIGRVKPALVEDLAAPFRPSDARAGY
jgi:hypothetical protein